jgi:hypothetical protein
MKEVSDIDKLVLVNLDFSRSSPLALSRTIVPHADVVHKTEKCSHLRDFYLDLTSLNTPPPRLKANSPLSSSSHINMPLKPRPASVPVGYADKNITRLRSDQLQKLLGKENIDFDGNAEKHELQALWTLFRMGLQDVADKLIEETADFWELSVVRQVEILKELGLPTTGNKLEHVVSYVESMFVIVPLNWYNNMANQMVAWTRNLIQTKK